MGNKILIRIPNLNREQTQSGLYIPENAMERQTVGEVIEIGPDVKRIAVGETVFFTEDEAEETGFKSQGERADDIWVIGEHNVLGKIEVLA